MSVSHVRILGVDIPLKIIREQRQNVRASFTSKGINLRIPSVIPERDLPKHFDWCKKWAEKTIDRNPSVAYKFIKKTYDEGCTLELYDQNYTLHFHQHHLKSRIRGEIVDHQIHIYTPVIPLDHHHTKKIIVHVLNHHYIQRIKERVDYINGLTIRQKYDRVVLKYLKSQWGNCGMNKTIKLSTRILFLPQKVQNAIILHELVHLVHMDHSHRFYDLLYKHMPDYDKRDQWLKENGGWMVF